MSHDKYPIQAESTRDGVLESASKRVRMIFSVMASPNRIDILRILNSKGPLTYSELKSLAGFKSKKESGKFAYHLRKLLRQSLVALNKGERRYTITNLGKLVLSLARQIEERSIIESGKMYVRTTRPSIEEFNSNKIIQSLVREANMPLEQAHKITEEVENKIYKFQAVYLTSSLIRETVNSVLIEHGHEDYRNKLARLGLPTSDIIEMLSNADTARNGLETLMSKASNSIFSEYLLINTLPKDIADMHLAGEMNISNSGTWGLIPDTIFLDINKFRENALDPKGKFLNVSRIPLPSIDNSNDFEAYLSLLISLLSREASTEVVLEGIIPLILEETKEPAKISSRFAKALVLSSTAPSYTESGLPTTTITIPADGQDAKSIAALLSGYQKYLDSTPVPRIGISLIYNDIADQQLGYHLDPIASLVRSGGIISLSHDDGLRASSGIRKSIGGKSSGTVVTLQSLSINLPRLAYQSNKDETYFRARLALMIKPALAALYIRKKAVAELIRKGTVPTLSSNSDFIQSGTTSIIINLIGARESVYDILGHRSEDNGIEVLQKVLKTSVDVALDQGRYIGEGSVGVAMIADDSAARFASLDSDKYGRAYLQSTKQNSPAYSQGLTLYGEQLLPSDDNCDSLIQECLSVDKLLSGGLSVALDLTELASNHVQLKKAIEVASRIPFFRPLVKIIVCNSCGKRSASRDRARCEFCGSSHMLLIP
ncbi:MAG TPA: anaerobic ribonucleoside-triphosphate reductase [Candidatus Nitrosopolaris sp.]|nr:anaerobic ribonucleoside-triphosphate reductase [Candidatus Nitrosopolaris sp.]